MSKPKIQNLGKIGDARLDLIPRLDDCAPGIRPVEYNVIVATVPATDGTQSEGKKIGAIFIPDDAAETLDLAMQVGRIVAQSPLAYSYDGWPDESLKPQIGDAVWFARYAGKDFTGVDGRQYRILKDKDIGAVIEEAPVSFVATGYGAQANNPFLKTGT
jgi:co-chaperonin GroES (HSP10)